MQVPTFSHRAASCLRQGRAQSSALAFIIRTGVHVELPPNTVGMLKSKSGLNIFHDIVGEGVIDEGFCAKER